MFFTVILVVEEQTSCLQFYIVIIFKMAKVQVKKGQKQASGCCHFIMADWDSHHYCPSCMDKGKGDDVCVVEKQEDCYICLRFTPEQVKTEVKGKEGSTKN